MYSPILKEKRAIMKTTKLAALILTIAVALFILIPSLSWAADDGAALYKANVRHATAPTAKASPPPRSLP